MAFQLKHLPIFFLRITIYKFCTLFSFYLSHLVWVWCINKIWSIAFHKLDMYWYVPSSSYVWWCLCYHSSRAVLCVVVTMLSHQFNVWLYMCYQSWSIYGDIYVIAAVLCLVITMLFMCNDNNLTTAVLDNFKLYRTIVDSLAKVTLLLPFIMLRCVTYSRFVNMSTTRVCTTVSTAPRTFIWRKWLLCAVTKVSCSPQCDGRCFGSQPNECCHPECAGGCRGPTEADCWVCSTCLPFYYLPLYYLTLH